MREIIVDKSEAGITFRKYIKKYFDGMPDGVFYKLLRKKYFEINEIKATGKEILKTNDIIKVFISDDTYEKFATKNANISIDDKNNPKVDSKHVRESIVYEDDNIIIFNKPKGMLSQNSAKSDSSVNSILYEYVNIKNNFYKPSILNRLDRNTSGLIIFAKTYIAAREISQMIRDDDIEKYYIALVNGNVTKKNDTLINYYRKDEKENKAYIYEYDGNENAKNLDVVKLEYNVIKNYENATLLNIHLLTGKSHQIRAQLSHIGYPIVCDKKYMANSLYQKNVSEYKTNSQKLKCYKIVFGEFNDENLKYLSNKEFILEDDNEKF